MSQPASDASGAFREEGPQLDHGGIGPTIELVAFVFDLNRDGVADRVNQEIRLHQTEPVGGRIVALSGDDGSTLATFASRGGGDAFGWAAVSLGDLDGDGAPELAISAPRHGALPGSLAHQRGVWGAVHILSGSSGRSIATTLGSQEGLFGTGLLVVTDLDGDSVPDLLVREFLLTAESNAGTDLLSFDEAWSFISTVSGDRLAGGRGSPIPGLEDDRGALEAFWLQGNIAGERRLLRGAPGDLTGDGSVTTDDLLALLERVGDAQDTSQQPIFDLTGDGIIDASDVAHLVEHLDQRDPDSPSHNAASRRNGSIIVTTQTEIFCAPLDPTCLLDDGGGGGGGGPPPPNCSGDSDCDGTPDVYDCDSPGYQGPAGGCNDCNGVKCKNDQSSPWYNPLDPDSDADGDGIPNKNDPDFFFRDAPWGLQDEDADSDGDGTSDVNDPFHPNYDKRHRRSDPDQDGLPNEDDDDDDDDGIPDANDGDPHSPAAGGGGGGGGGCRLTISGPGQVATSTELSLFADHDCTEAGFIQWRIANGGEHVLVLGNSDLVGSLLTLRALSEGSVWFEAKLIDLEGIPTGHRATFGLTIANDPLPTPPECWLTIDSCPEIVALPETPGLGTQVVLTASGDISGAEWTVSENVETATADGDQLSLTITEPGVVSVFVQGSSTLPDGTTCFAGDSCSFDAVRLNLTIDSNNDGFVDANDDEVEEGSGAKVLIVNRGDRNQNNIPDYAEAPSLIPGPFAALMSLSLEGNPDLEGSFVSFEYDSNDPSGLVVTEVTVSDIESSYSRYDRGGGHLRIWRQDSGEFIGQGVSLDLGAIGANPTFIVEAANGSPIVTEIRATVSLSNGGVISDTVRVLPFDSTSGILETEINGFTIFSGSTAGTPGRDIIIGTASNDEISGDAGDDIIVGGYGDDTIYGGPGSDIIFASRGHNMLYPNGSGALATTTSNRVAGGDTDVILDEEDKPFTSEQVLQAYRLLHGDNDPWLRIFLEKINGSVRAVEKVGPLRGYTKAEWDRCDEDDLGETQYFIDLEFSIADEFKAASILREQLLDLAGHGYKPRIIFEGEIMDQIVNGLAQAQDADEATGPIEDYNTLRALAFENARATTALIANAYVQGIAMTSRGADLALIISDVTDALTQSRLNTSISLVPNITSSITSTTRILIKLPNGAIPFVATGRVLRGSDSELGMVTRRGMVKEEFLVNDQLVLLRGTAQRVIERPAGVPTPTNHAPTVLRHAMEAVNSGEAEYVVMNRSLYTATALDNLGVARDWIPDLVVIKRNGKIDLYEIKSNGQTLAEIEAKLETMMSALPVAHQGDTFALLMDP